MTLVAAVQIEAWGNSGKAHSNSSNVVYYLLGIKGQVGLQNRCAELCISVPLLPIL